MMLKMEFIKPYAGFAMNYCSKFEFGDDDVPGQQDSQNTVLATDVVFSRTRIYEQTENPQSLLAKVVVSY